MSLTRALALYGALVASFGIAWQVFTWRAARKNRVSVDLTYGFLDTGPRLVDSIVVTVTNRHDHRIRVKSLGFNAQDGTTNRVAFMAHSVGDNIPGEILPHDSGSAYPRLADLATVGVDVYRPLVGWAKLGTGETIESPARTLMKRP